MLSTESFFKKMNAFSPWLVESVDTEPTDTQDQRYKSYVLLPVLKTLHWLPIVLRLKFILVPPQCPLQCHTSLHSPCAPGMKTLAASPNPYVCITVFNLIFLNPYIWIIFRVSKETLKAKNAVAFGEERSWVRRVILFSGPCVLVWYYKMHRTNWRLVHIWL